MANERNSLQQSLALTRREWKTLKYWLHSESLGLSRATERPKVSQHSAKSGENYLRTWKKSESSKSPAPSCDFNQSYRRILSTAQSNRSRKVSDVTWRSEMNRSPTKHSEGGIDIATASVTQYLQWHREHPNRLSQRRASEEQGKGRNNASLPA